ncbi:hypothetical protein CXG81DRAFT_25106 [Caulochytrium protostelioides]|uniref:Uncharacterized protein n=1 Tax=Caulochytrium protostelioides TaxID=1555241 RepID=A0A4P9XAA4_9FUNG|nr:hypothetical protein CXG81DRAFT_25106 [Caulochytrium protostelioides]|eukprot:RKP02245.1 hypothetical protein CXG81DRAFT_25106 [Caulochytrium protostelioides]
MGGRASIGGRVGVGRRVGMGGRGLADVSVRSRERHAQGHGTGTGTGTGSGSGAGAEARRGLAAAAFAQTDPPDPPDEPDRPEQRRVGGRRRTDGARRPVPAMADLRGGRSRGVGPAASVAARAHHGQSPAGPRRA